MNLAYGITNKIKEDRYFLVLDYDNIDYNTVETEIVFLQQKFFLGTATIFSTGTGFHVYFFIDNKLSKEQVGNILDSTKHVDKNFIDNFYNKDNEGITIRLGGKYEKQDIRFFGEIQSIKKDSEFSKLEIAMGKSLRDLVQSNIKEQMFKKLSQIKGIEEEENKTKPEEKINEVSGITQEELSEVFETVKDLGLNKPEKKKRMKVDINQHVTNNPKITEARKKWYSENISRIVKRLISTGSENRECALTRPHELKDISVDGFIDYRPFYLNNSGDEKQMEKPFNYVYEKTLMEELPFNFFQSHALYDIENIPKVPLMSFNKQKELKEEIRNNRSDYITGFDIVFDIDSKDLDDNKSYVEAKKMKDVLKKLELPFYIVFSGSKGFHFRIDSNEINKAAPEIVDFLKANKNNIKIIFNNLIDFGKKNNIEIDAAAYNGDLSALIRVPWSVHPKTGCVVKPLSDSEFDKLEGKKLRDIQEIYKVENLLSGNKKIGAEKINFQKKDFIIRINTNGEYLTWEEMRDSGSFEKMTDGKTEWENIRNNFINPTTKELRDLADKNPKKFNEILEKGEYNDFLVEAPEYIDLTTGRNYNYKRRGNMESLRNFVLLLIKE